MQGCSTPGTEFDTCSKTRIQHKPYHKINNDLNNINKNSWIQNESSKLHNCEQSELLTGQTSTLSNQCGLQKSREQVYLYNICRLLNVLFKDKHGWCISVYVEFSQQVSCLRKTLIHISKLHIVLIGKCCKLLETNKQSINHWCTG